MILRIPKNHLKIPTSCVAFFSLDYSNPSQNKISLILTYTLVGLRVWELKTGCYMKETDREDREGDGEGGEDLSQIVREHGLICNKSLLYLNQPTSFLEVI